MRIYQDYPGWIQVKPNSEVLRKLQYTPQIHSQIGSFCCSARTITSILPTHPATAYCIAAAAGWAAAAAPYAALAAAALYVAAVYACCA